MFIYHFNRIIRNRFIWAGFAIMIAAAFISVDSCVGGVPQNQSVGKLGGKSVSTEEFDRTASVLRGLGRNRDTQTPQAKIDEQTWREIAARRTAAQMGLAAADSEVAEAIQNEFAGNGGFNFDTYRKLLADNGLSPKIYEQIKRDQLLMSKLYTVLNAGAWVAPMEIEDELSAMTDQFTIRTLTLDNPFAAQDMPLTDEKLQTFYADNTASFAKPDQMGVRYVTVAVSNFIDAAAATVRDEDIQDYYENNATKYTRTTTNGTETIPLEQVKDAVRLALAKEDARYIAATNLSARVIDRAMASSFDAAAAEAGLTIAETALFSERLPPRGMADTAAFLEGAFELDASRLDTRYGLVKGENLVYVLTPYTNIPAHTPAFEEVVDLVRQRAGEEERAKAFETFAADKTKTVAATLTSGASLADALKALGPAVQNLSTSITFSVSTLQTGSEFPYAMQAAPAAIRLSKGKISEPIALPNGDALLVYVEDRKAGDVVSAEMMRTQVRSQAERRRASALFQDWLTSNMKQLGLTDNRRAAAVMADAAPNSSDDEE